MEMILYIFIGIIGRLLPHLPNATPVGALALLGGSRLGLIRGTVIVLAIMLVSDLALGLHPVMWATYGAFLLSVFIGKIVIRKVRPVSVLTSALFASVSFFVITNFAVWVIPGSMYPKTVSGLISCYLAAIPFFRNQVTADLFYSTVFFTGYLLAGEMGIKRFGSAILVRIGIRK